MEEQLAGKVSIVTGASSGLGEVIAVMFASRGAKVTLCGRDEERLKIVYNKMCNLGRRDRCIVIAGDVNDGQVRAEIVSKTVQKFGRLDILVANAGVAFPNMDIRTATETTFDLIMNTNLKSVFFLIQQAVPHLEKSKGVIINISSILSSMVSSFGGIYSISKAALDHLSRCLAVDLGPKGIRVTTVNPSYFPTRISREFDSFDDRGMAERESKQQPLEGLLVTTEVIAETVAFLSSDAAKFITGENIKVDGGRSYMGPFSYPQRTS